MTEQIISENFTDADTYVWDASVWLYIPPILIPVGFCENILAVLVLARPRFSQLPCRITLIAIAIVDMIVLFFGLTRFWTNVMFDTNLQTLSEAVCKMLSPLVISCSHLSSLLVALLSVERFCSVYRPHNRFHTPVDYFGVPVLTFFCLGIFFVYYHYTILTPGIPGTKHDKVCVSTSQTVAIILDLLDTALLCLIPLVIISVSNTFIIYRLYQNTKKLDNYHNSVQSTSRHMTGDSEISSVDQRSCLPQLIRKKPRVTHPSPKLVGFNRQKRITITLLLITSSFVLFTFPFTVVHLSRTVDNERRTSPWNMSWLITYILVYVNNCLNFPIYIISQPYFYGELKAMMRSGCCQ
ncbi:G-protein coupled receptor fragment [Clonorchis sinensis]|uniref:G-protein coupled receptor n=1 Tax=Clonorchis sinensis TaxID=79923 RepID=G7Y6K2_CLOSI|nr:G-protein coupled receptor fragment [Clonorchis sinensis]